MDYKVFIMNSEKKLLHIGDINNVTSFAKAKQRLINTSRNNSSIRGQFFLVRYENMIKVNIQ